MPALLKLRLFEFLAAYDIVIWGLKMKTGGVSMTNNAPLVSSTVPIQCTVQPQRGSCIYLAKTGDSEYFLGQMGWVGHD